MGAIWSRWSDSFYQELPAKLAGLSDGQRFLFLGSISPRNAGGFELPVLGGKPVPYLRGQRSAAGTPFRLHTVTAPVTGPANARSRVVVSIGSAPAAARKFCRTRAVSQTISSGNGLTAAAIRR